MSVLTDKLRWWAFALGSNPWVRVAVVGIACLAVGYGAGRYATPAKTVEIKVLDETAIARAVENARAEWQKTVKTKKTATTSYGPTGKPVQRVEEITSESHSDGSSESAKTETAEQATHSATQRVTETGRPGWAFGAGTAWNLAAPTLRPERYDVEVSRRLFGTLWLGVTADSDKRVGARVRLEW